MYVRTHLTYVHMYVRTYVCMYIHAYICTYICMHVCTYIHMYVHMYVGVYVYTKDRIVKIILLTYFIYLLFLVHPCDNPNNGGCRQICNKRGKGFYCSCNNGFRLARNKHNCIRGNGTSFARIIYAISNWFHLYYAAPT